jgi:CubicO group peptidase (beta-lactamase class C family)
MYHFMTCVPSLPSSRSRCCGFRAALPPTRDQLFALLGGYLESLRVQAGIPGMAAAIMDNDGLAWEQAFGNQDLSRSFPTRTDTPFHLDGVTQLFAATLVLRCVEDGRLTLDTPVSTFSPSSPDASATIGQILTHTSGDERPDVRVGQGDWTSWPPP